MPEDCCQISGTQNLLALRRRLARATDIALNEILSLPLLSLADVGEIALSTAL